MNKKTLIFILSVTAITLSFIIIFLISNYTVKPPKITVLSVSPLPGATEVGYRESIKIEVNSLPKYLDLLSLEITPKVTLTRQSENQTLAFIPNEPLDPLNTYSLTIYQKGVEEPIYSWQFTTIRLQNDSNWSETVKSTNDQYYPLISYLPIKNDDFEIYYVGRLSLEILTYNPDTEYAKQKALAFIRSKGVDPEIHQISYIEMAK
jgi:hypothetical protein